MALIITLVAAGSAAWIAKVRHETLASERVGINQLTAFKEIHLSCRSVESWDGLVSIPSLKRISIFPNPIPDDHSPLKVLQNLDELSLNLRKLNADQLKNIEQLLPNTKITCKR